VCSSDLKDYVAAEFMMAVCLGCAGEERRGRTMLETLRRTAIGPALGMACKDLVGRMRANNLDGYARSLEAATAAL
jgi:hypothetical protein